MANRHDVSVMAPPEAVTAHPSKVKLTCVSLLCTDQGEAIGVKVCQQPFWFLLHVSVIYSERYFVRCGMSRR